MSKVKKESINPNWIINNSASIFDKRVITLLTPYQYKKLANGTILHTIFGETKYIGIDSIDEWDTRGGFLSVGIMLEKEEE